MDFTKVECISEQCKGKHIIMDGAGGSFGLRISYANLKCPECGVKIMIMPLNDKYEYSMRATTKEERIEKDNSVSLFNEALRVMRDLAEHQNGAPLIRHEEEYNKTMTEVWDFLEANER